MSLKLVSKVSLVALVFGLTTFAAHAGEVSVDNVKQSSASVKWETDRIYRSYVVTLTKNNSTKPIKRKRVSNSKKRKKFKVTFEGLQPGQEYKARVRGTRLAPATGRRSIGTTSFTTRGGSSETASNSSSGSSSNSSSGKSIQPHLITPSSARIRWNPTKKKYKNYKVFWREGNKLVGTSKWLPSKSRVYIIRRLDDDTEYTVTVRAKKLKSKGKKKKGNTVRLGTAKFKTKKRSG